MAQPFFDEFTCLLPDIRGRGKSVSRDPKDHSWNQYADDVIGLLQENKIEEAVLIGVSMGAGLGIATALRSPDRVSALALISSPYAGAESGWTPSQLSVQTGVLKTAERILQGKQDEAFPSGEVPEKWGRHDLVSIAAAIAGLGLSQPFKRAEELRSIGVPVFIAQGNDDLHPAEIGAMYESSFPNIRQPGERPLKEGLQAFLSEI